MTVCNKIWHFNSTCFFCSRFFENFIHLSYKLPIKKWQANKKEDKDIVSNRKKKIQAEFKIKTGLIIDKPKQSYGNSNDGNTARRFFDDAETTAEITGLV